MLAQRQLLQHLLQQSKYNSIIYRKYFKNGVYNCGTRAELINGYVNIQIN